MDKSGGGDSRDGMPSSNPSTASSSSAAPTLGCGSSTSSGSPSAALMTLNVTTTTGGSFSVAVDGENSVENLKKIISKKLKVSKDRICLLHRERELHDGTLRENGLADGSKLILTPNVETGLLAQRAENTVMQALESLNDNQVNDFLSGKSPLNLSVRLGDHMMLIQLQLSTLNPTSQSGNRSKTHKSRSGTSSSSGASPMGATGPGFIQASSSRSHSRTTIPLGFRRAGESAICSSRPIVEQVNEAQSLSKKDIDNIHNIVKNLAASETPTIATITPSEPMDIESEARPTAAESPIKSLSNLVSSSIESSIPPAINNNILPVGPPSPCADPISANLTSCLCKRLDNNDNSSCESNCLLRTPEPQQPSTSTTHLHRTAHNPIARHKTKVQALKKHFSFDGTTLANTELDSVQPVNSLSAPNSPQRAEHSQQHRPTHHQLQFNSHSVSAHRHHQHQHHHHQHHQPHPPVAHASNCSSRTLNADPDNVENPALAEASRNLTQTLRKLSKRVFTNKASDAAQETARNVSSGAVIESMKHHGKGIYSGTFSGTLNPALQDKFGRPKRDISTIIHILNDLLSAAPQCARSGTKIYFEPSPPSAATAAGAALARSLRAASEAGPSGGSSSNGSSSIGGSSSSRSTSSGTNLQAAAVMAPTTGGNFTTPIAAPSPRLVSRCVPTPIHTKKYPSNGATTTVPCAGSSCKTIDLDVPSSSATIYGNRCHHQQQQQQQQKIVTKALCKCGLPLALPSSLHGTGSGQHCQRCIAISAAELENSKTKTKLDNLRLIMQQKKERREARKQKCVPYSMASPGVAAAVAASSTVAVTGLSSSSSSSGSMCTLSHRQLPVVSLTNTTAIAAGVDAPAAKESPKLTATTSNTNTSVGGSNSAATATATATTTTTSAAAAAAAATATTSSEAAQSHQIVEEVDTVA